MKNDFKAVGGVWIEMQNKYKTFDGSHLTVAEAKHFSRELVIKIKTLEMEDE